MMLSVDFPAERVDNFVRYVFADQLPFVEQQAINETGREGQRVQRAHQRAVFEVRRPGFVDSAVKQSPRATKQKPETRLIVEPLGGPSRASIISQHEADEVKTPFRRRAIAVPTRHVPTTGAGIIKKGWRPKDLFDGAGVGSSDRVLTRGGGTLVRNQVVRGKHGTFMIRRPDGRGTIFIRDGEELEPLYQLVTDVDLDQRLKFISNIGDAAMRSFPDYFVKWLDRAIRSAR